MSRQVPWPRQLSQLDWPRDGVQFSYEHRGYVKPHRLGFWLESAFGQGNAKYQLFNQRLYVQAPREPTREEYRWLQDSKPDSEVYVDEMRGYLKAPRQPKGRA